MQTTGSIATVGIVGVGSATASSGTLTNATVTGDGSIVATGDNFAIAGQELTVNNIGVSPVIFNNGYSGEIYGNKLTVENINRTTIGIGVQGGDVTVYDNTVDASDDLNNQFVAVGFIEGGTGKIRNNEITGKHRVGVYANGSGTDVDISRNTIVGSGPTTTGWADNGVQVGRGATGAVRRNTIDAHWWNNNDWVSSGILAIETDNMNMQHNSLENNDRGISIRGERNNALHNDVTVTYDDTDIEHYGVIEYGGRNNGMRRNTITAAGDDDALYGIIAAGNNTKLIGNNISGWQTEIAAPGEDTKLPKPFDPDS